MGTVVLSFITLVLLGFPESIFTQWAITACVFVTMLLLILDGGVQERRFSHANLAQRYGELGVELFKFENTTPERHGSMSDQRDEISALQRKRIETERLETLFCDLQASEPNRLRLVYDLCYREVLISVGCDEEAEKMLLPKMFWRMCAAWGDFGYVAQAPVMARGR